MRLNQYLAHYTGVSRRQADRLIEAGQVQVNGQTVPVGTQVDPAHDKIVMNGSPVQARSYEYIMFHKPAGHVASRTRQGKSQTIYHLLPPHFHQFKIVGRLDKDSSGLMLLTNDGNLAETLLHPRYGKQKRYQLILDRPLAAADLAKLTEGIRLDDGLSRPTSILTHGPTIELTLSEGRNRQLRRTFEALGYQVKALTRTSFGKLKLGTLAVNHWQAVSKDQIL